jgi:hypothetical protein
MAEESAASLVSKLSDHDAERVLQSVTERLVQQAGDLAADNEEEAREIIAAAVSRYGAGPLSADDVAPAVAPPASLARATLALLARDPGTAGLVRDTVADLPEETQMVVDPVTIAVVLAGLVAFLQTKFSLKVRRVDGKLDVEFTLSKEAASDETIKEVITAVGGASSGTWPGTGGQ